MQLMPERQTAAGPLTKMPDMGYHFLNPRISRFDVTEPPILVYKHRGSTWPGFP